MTCDALVCRSRHNLQSLDLRLLAVYSFGLVIGTVATNNLRVVLTDGRTKPASLENVLYRVRHFGKHGWKRVKRGSKSFYKGAKQGSKSFYKGAKRGLRDTFGTPTLKDEHYYQQKADRAAYKAQLKAERAAVKKGLAYEPIYDDVQL